MASRRTNLALLAVLIAAAGTGVAAFAAGTPWGVVVVAAHGMTGLAVVVLVPWKATIADRGLRRRRVASTWPGILLAALVVVTVLSGILRTAGLVRSYGPLTDMQVHVGSAVAAGLLGIWHVLARGPRPRRRDLSRRNLVRAGSLLAGAGMLYASLEGVWRLAGLPGGRRRFTGSHEQGSHDPAAMPVVQWLDDRVPRIAAGRWRLTVARADGTVRATLRAADLRAFDDEVVATLDCTGGWYARQRWTGVRLSRLIGAPGAARSVVVASATGYTRRFPVRDLPHLLLATRVEGRPLSPGHGFPARLVAPGRRGFWWVKWVQRLVLSPRPWWLDLPFPVT